MQSIKQCVLPVITTIQDDPWWMQILIKGCKNIYIHQKEQRIPKSFNNKTYITKRNKYDAASY